MKKIFINSLIAVTIISSLSSCATVFGGRITDEQRTRPLPGQPSRALRPVALIADVILFWPGIIVDFATGAIYRPTRNTVVKPADVETRKTVSIEKTN